MKLQDIIRPVKDDLQLVRAELANLLSGLEASPSKLVLEHFLKKPGKLLRPALLLLSAAAAGPEGYSASRPELVKAAAAVELIHSASLIHDDIVDNEEERRGQKTLNKVFGSKIAVMAGNILFARAVAFMLEELPRETTIKTIQMIRKMSTVEIHRQNRRSQLVSRDDYIELITGKTALLMSHSCAIGAGIATDDRSRIEALEAFGLNFGITYQITDDCIDRDDPAKPHVSMKDAAIFAKTAVSYLEDLDASVYIKALRQMPDYVLSHTHAHNEAAAGASIY